MATILFRADAGPAIGLGHVMRCLAVAEVLRDRGHVCMAALIESPPVVRRRLGQGGLALAPGGEGLRPGSAEDLDWTVALISRIAPAVVVLDGYRFDVGYRAGVATAGVPVVAFDDLADLPALHAALVVNPSPAAPTLPYPTIAPSARLLLGPAYVLLRQEIRQAMAAPRPALADRQVLFLNFGGADPLGLTEPCLTALAPILPPGCRLTVATGGADPRAAAVAGAAVRFGDRVAVYHQSERLGGLMAEAGLAVSAAGGTAGELAALGVPTVLVISADNQVPGAQAAAADGCVRVLDGRDPQAAEVIAATAAALWRDLPARCALAHRVAARIDGLGSVRVAEAMLALAC